MLYTVSLSANESLLTSADSAIRKHKKNQAVLVDVRNQKAFDTIRIPGSLNIPLYAVKTKPFLKTKPLVLINEGYAVTPLQDECRSLNQKGFTATVLLGGLNVWALKKGPLEGDMSAVNTFSMVSPSDFHSQKQSNTLIIDLSPKQFDLSKNLLPNALLLSEICYPKGTETPLRSLRLCGAIKNKMTSSSTILLFNQDGEGYEKIQDEVAKEGILPVFCLQGGINGYSRFLNDLMLAQKPKEERVKSMDGCKPCREKKKEKE